MTAEYAGYGLSPELIQRIAGIENICGIKIPRPDAAEPAPEETAPPAEAERARLHRLAHGDGALRGLHHDLEDVGAVDRERGAVAAPGQAERERGEGKETMRLHDRGG